MKKQKSLILITILGLFALFANVSTFAQDSDSDSSGMQVESSEDTGTISSTPAYVSDDEEEDTSATTTSSSSDDDFTTSTDSDI